MSPALQKILTDLSGRNLMRSGKTGYTAMCPGHEDNRNSLSIDEGKDGKVLLNCFAGCEAAAICEAMKWEMADLFPPKPERAALNIVATYDYRDEAGELLSQVVRLEPKSFRQRRPDGNGGWVYQLGDVRRVLYRLPELKGKRKGVVFVEGEKDADALWALKIPATTNLGGANAWRPELVENLKWAGVKRVVILPDNDAPGRKHARAVARDCHAAGIEVVLCALPGLPEKGDVSDFLATAQYPKGDLVRAVQEHGQAYSQEAEQEEDDRPAPSGGWRRPTDLDATEITYLIDRMIPRGMLGSISGRDGRGKSLLGLEIAKSCLTGQSLFDDFTVTEQGPVYMVLLDDPENLIRKRLDQLGILEHPDLFIKTVKDVQPDGAEDWDRIEFLRGLASEFEAMERKPVFVLIDALYIFVPSSGRSGADQGNSAGAMMPIMQEFDAIATKSGATVGLVIHNNKADADIQGSQAIRNMLKWILMLTLPKKFEKDRNAGRITPDRILQLGKIKTGQPTEWGFRLRGTAEGLVLWESVPLEELEKGDKLAKERERRQACADWLKFFLETGARTSGDVIEAGREMGHKKKTIESPAVADLAGVEKISQGGTAPWLWRLRGQA